MDVLFHMAEIALDSLHKNNQEQIMGVASYVSPVSPPPFAAQFAEVTVDTETGQVTVDRLVMAVDSGIIINPLTASGQIEGGMTQALGYAVCEEMRYDEKGVALERDFDRYHIFRADEMPELETIFVETFEPSHPFGVKAVAEIPHGRGRARRRQRHPRCRRRQMWTIIPSRPEKVWTGVKINKQYKSTTENKMPDQIYVIGHVNPDTDSIASAMGYAWLSART